MRLYLKLFAMVVTAAVIQLTIAGPGEWLDETQFALRVYVAGKLGVPPQSPALVDAADRLRARHLVRAERLVFYPPFPAGSSPASVVKAEQACDEDDVRPPAYARAG